MSIIEISNVLPGHSQTSISSSGTKFSYWSESPNSAGGVGIKHEAYNASEKIIKYLTFTYIPYNQVGDVVQSKTDGKIEATGRITGPIDPNEKFNVEWDVMWYNPTISMAVIKEVKVEYMDGSEEIILGADIKNIDSEDSVYYEKRGKAEKEKKKKEAFNSILTKSYIPFLVLTNLKAAKTNEDIRFHTNQGLILFALEILGFILGLIPRVGGFITMAIWIVAAVFSVKGIIDIKKGVKNELPLIGKIKLLK